MKKVLEQFKHENYTLLICERDERQFETKRILTNIGYIDKPDFVIFKQTACFSEPKTTDVGILNPIDCSPIKWVKLIVDGEDVDDILYEGTKEQIIGIRCPNCGGNIKYTFSSFGENDTRFVTECMNCHTIGIRHSGPEPNCVKYFGDESVL